MSDMFWIVLSLIVAIPLVISASCLIICASILVYQDKEAARHVHDA